MRQLQPGHAFNTIITMSQRNNADDYARRAYRDMIKYGYGLDVFASTALLDVVGRNGDPEESFRIYDEMIRSDVAKPNIVTLVTIIRITANMTDKFIGIPRIFRILSDAKTLADNSSGSQVGTHKGVIDISIYNSALAASVRYIDLPLLSHILKMIREDINKTLVDSPRQIEASYNFNSLSYEILGKFVKKYSSTENNLNPQVKNVLGYLNELNLLDSGDILQIEKLSNERESRYCEAGLSNAIDGANCATKCESPFLKQSSVTVKSPYVESMSCLGPKTPISMRDTVVHHDLLRLAQRVLRSRRDGTSNFVSALQNESSLGNVIQSSYLSESDFITLIHQCRKRKWGEQVQTILQFVTDLSTIGIQELEIPAIFSIALSHESYEAAFEAYFATGCGMMAWNLFDSLFQLVSGDEISTCLLTLLRRDSFPMLIIR